MGLSLKTQRILIAASAIILLVMQLAGASYAQGRVSAGSIADGSTVICTPDGLNIIRQVKTNTPPNGGLVDCSCPACAFFGEVDWDRNIPRSGDPITYRRPGSVLSASYHPGMTNILSLVTTCCTGARPPPIYL